MRIMCNNFRGSAYEFMDLQIEGRTDDSLPPPLIRAISVEDASGHMPFVTIERYVREGEAVDTYPDSVEISRSWDPLNRFQVITSKHIVTSIDISTNESSMLGRMGRNPATGSPIPEPTVVKPPEPKPVELPKGTSKPKEFPSPIPDSDL